MQQKIALQVIAKAPFPDHTIQTCLHFVLWCFYVEIFTCIPVYLLACVFRLLCCFLWSFIANTVGLDLLSVTAEQGVMKSLIFTKEKELALALMKVAELTSQLEHLRRGHVDDSLSKLSPRRIECISPPVCNPVWAGNNFYSDIIMQHSQLLLRS